MNYYDPRQDPRNYDQAGNYHGPQVVYHVQAPAMMVKPPFSHGGHLVLDVLSCGMWLPVHLILWACH